MSIFLELAMTARADARLSRRHSRIYPNWPGWEQECLRRAHRRYLHALDYLQSERKLRSTVQ